MRLNARLPDELAEKLGALERLTGQTASEIVRAALERYYETVCGSRQTARDAILGSGLVGCGEAEAELSTTYKARLFRGKHGDR